MKTLIDIKDLDRTYWDNAGQEIAALRNINLQIREGEFITFIGSSGCGKTTLLRLIAGLDRPERGEISYDGNIIDGPSFDRGFIFQQSALYPWLSVRENAAFGLRARGVYDQKQKNIDELIKMMGLEGFENAYPYEISGGMAQRVSIIRSLINEPKILLLDEPLGALDAFKRVEMQNLLLDVWKKTKTTMAMVTHDVDEAIYLSERIAIMTSRPGRISEILNVDIADRNRNSDEFILLRKKILEILELASAPNQAEFYL